MARFKLGDYVSYTNKGNGFPEKHGTIIAHWKGGDYIIRLDEPSKHFMVSSKDIYTNQSTFFEHEFNPPSFNYRRTISRDCLRIGVSSSGLKHGEKPYDPTQQGDQDDDI